MSEQDYDQRPTDVAAEPPWETFGYWLEEFEVPTGLMPDKRFDGRKARLWMNRVKPRRDPPVKRAVVLIHGRTVPGPVVFDLRDPDPFAGAARLSVQKALARAGIDTFAPSLLGYSFSTRFDDGLNDPGNASLRPYSDGSCAFPEGCDRTIERLREIYPLDQQGELDPTKPSLWVNPLGEQRRAHSSNFRFARTDVWVRDIDQVIQHAIERADPADDKVVLVGYSVGGQHVGRTLYAGNPRGGQQLKERAEIIDMVSSVVFVNSLFGGPPEEVDPFTPPTFSLTVNGRPGSDDLWKLTEPVPCTGRVIPGTRDQVWKQTLEHDPVGSEWGGDDPNNPTGLNRAPTFSGYGWNSTVARQLKKPTLVIQGLKDGVLPNVPNSTEQVGPKTGEAIFKNLTAAEHKVLVQIECASHVLQWEGCAEGFDPPPERCTPAGGGIPYGETEPVPWSGPHATFKTALIEWIKDGRFNKKEDGSFIVDESGVAKQVS